VAVAVSVAVSVAVFVAVLVAVFVAVLVAVFVPVFVNVGVAVPAIEITTPDTGSPNPVTCTGFPDVTPTPFTPVKLNP
jgi:hypothetical protein